MIRISGLGTAEPKLEVSQEETLDFVLKNFAARNGARELYRKVFANESVRKRRFSLKKLEDVMDPDLDRLNRRFESAGVELSTRSLRSALASARTSADELDFLAVGTCTGYLCPGLASRLIETCGLRRDARYVEVVGMGCGGAIPLLEQCHNFLKANPGKKAASVSTEICSAAFCPGDEPDLVVSNALFADGSAACVVADSGAGPKFGGFASLSIPEEREALRFGTREGRLRNIISKKVPELAGEAVLRLTDRLLAQKRWTRSDVSRWIIHSGGQKVLDAVRAALELPEEALAVSRANLASRGNLSSASVLFALSDLLASTPPAPGERALIAAFGAGFSVHACLLEF